MDKYNSSLHRGEEEDQIDYDDSDIEGELNTDQTTSVAGMIEELDIFADDTKLAEFSDEKDDSLSNLDEPVEEYVAPILSTSSSTTTKTREAAAVIKSLSDLLTNSDFRATLGLVKAGSALDLSFWADGFDFALSLKILGTAKVKVCKYGVDCRNKMCTFEHGGADRIAVVAGKKLRKLCSVINTFTGCSKGHACWFSHEALGTACADGNLRATCVKGIYCVYKHKDDEIEVPVEHAKQWQRPVSHGEEAEKIDTPAQATPIAKLLADDAKTESTLPTTTASNTTAFPKQQASRLKRRRDTTVDTEDALRKTQRVNQRHSRRELLNQSVATTLKPAGLGVRGQDCRGSGQLGRDDRGRTRSRRDGGGGRSERDGRGGRSDTYRPFEGRRRSGQEQSGKVPLETRISRD